MRKAMLLTAVLIVAPHAAAADFELQLRVTPASVVSGLSPSVEVDVTNRSDRRMDTPLSAAMIVTPLDGRQPFVAAGLVVSVQDDWNNYVRELAPRQRTTLLFPATFSLSNPEFFLDERLERPGSYRLQLSFVPHGMWHEALLAAPEKGWLSNAVTFTVAEPVNDDARVCELVALHLKKPGCPIRDVAARAWQHPELVRTIVEDHPRSSYTPYFRGIVRAETDAERLMKYEALLAQIGPDAPLADWYRWRIAQLHEIGSYGNDEKAPRHEAAAKAIWTQLSKSKEPALRNHATRKLREIAESSE